MSEVALKEPKSQSPARKSAARLAAVQALYLMDFSAASSKSTVGDFLQRKIPREAETQVPQDFDEELFSLIVHGATRRAADVRQLLDGCLDAKWPFDRLERILKAILRAGAGELLENSKTDSAIILNDYVNLAHDFFAGNEPSMVNAVLDKVAKSLRS